MLHKDVTDEALGLLLAGSALPILLELGAAWCGPCRQLAPVIEALAAQYAGRLEVATVDIDAEPAIAQRYGVMSVPTVIAFTGGHAVRTVTGPSKAALRALAEELAG